MTVWPQLLIIVLFILRMINHTVNHGKQRKYDAYGSFGFVLVWSYILYQGGFWNVFFRYINL